MLSFNIEIKLSNEQTTIFFANLQLSKWGAHKFVDFFLFQNLESIPNSDWQKLRRVSK